MPILQKLLEFPHKVKWICLGSHTAMETTALRREYIEVSYWRLKNPIVMYVIDVV